MVSITLEGLWMVSDRIVDFRLVTCSVIVQILKIIASPDL